ncbi:aminoglycoside phosphotransferase family protein [Actinopolymorpha sp. B9G3]|uniref:phosphotransferase family protein n=1 Tax=Actinopolymorpha sp. B9G3 TaxID=3158970 RepID=UPI0032D9A423
MAIYRQMGQILRRIHTIRFAKCGEISGGELIAAGTNADYMRGMFAQQLQDFDALGGPADLGDPMRRFVAQHDPALTTSQGGVLCHNDYVDGNIHVTETSHGWQVSGVVDVERAVVADPLLDVARSTRSKSAWFAAFGAGYGVRVGVDDELLALYDLYHVLELWDWFAKRNWAEQLPDLERDIARRVT